MFHPFTKIFAAGLLAILVSGAQAIALPQIFTWSGFCNDGDCGPLGGQASAILTVRDGYTPGENIFAADLLAFSYFAPPINGIGGDVSAVFPADFIEVGGSLPIGGNGNTDFSITFASSDPAIFGYTFLTTVDGSWSIGEFSPFDSGVPGSSTWGTVPEPASLALLGIALMGLGLRRRRLV